MRATKGALGVLLLVVSAGAAGTGVPDAAVAARAATAAATAPLPAGADPDFGGVDAPRQPPEVPAVTEPPRTPVAPQEGDGGPGTGDGGGAASSRPTAQHRRAAAQQLRLTGFEVGATADDPDLHQVARRVGIGVGHSIEAADVQRIVRVARQRVRAGFVLLGLHPGTVVDEADVRAGARLARLSIGRSVDAPDVRRIVAAARRTLRTTARRGIAPGLAYDRLTWRRRGGNAVVHRLSWRLDDERVRATTEAAGRLGGRRSVVNAFRSRRGDDVAAVVNGGFWLGAGDPDGLLVTDGALLSEPGTGRSWVREARGAFGWRGGRHVVGWPVWYGVVRAQAFGELALRGVDRPLRIDDVVVATRAASLVGRRGLQVVVAGASVPQSGRTTGTVVGLTRSRRAAIPRGGLVLAASGASADILGRLTPGDEVTLETVMPGLENVDQAMAGGPLLLAGGAATSVSSWRDEGFGPRHNQRRHPRTAVGFDGRGGAFVVIVDGRQPGYSTGATTRETANLMQGLGAVDAVMLDGGGSSQLAFGGRTVNRDCCDRSHRAVASVLAFYRS